MISIISITLDYGGHYQCVDYFTTAKDSMVSLNFGCAVHHCLPFACTAHRYTLFFHTVAEINQCASFEIS